MTCEQELQRKRHVLSEAATPDSGKTAAQTMTTLFFSSIKGDNKSKSYHRNLNVQQTVACLAKEE